jgi:hypothetical protein
MAAMMSIGYIPKKSNQRTNGTRMKRNMKYSRSGTKGKEKSGQTKKKQSSNGYRKFPRMNPKVNKQI